MDTTEVILLLSWFERLKAEFEQTGKITIPRYKRLALPKEGGEEGGGIIALFNTDGSRH